MSVYATVDNVISRLGGRDISATTKPTYTQVADLLEEAEAELISTLEAAGMPSTYTGNGATTIRGWVAAFIAGIVLASHSRSVGDGSGVAQGEAEIERWEARLRRIEESPERFGAQLTGGSLSNSQIGLRSYITDNSDSKTIDNGDFDPKFEKDDWF